MLLKLANTVLILINTGPSNVKSKKTSTLIRKTIATVSPSTATFGMRYILVKQYIILIGITRTLIKNKQCSLGSKKLPSVRHLDLCDIWNALHHQVKRIL